MFRVGGGSGGPRILWYEKFLLEEPRRPGGAKRRAVSDSVAEVEVATGIVETDEVTAVQ